jgi:hypothetical protein
MENKDKFGNTIYPSVFSKLQIIGEKLLSLDFKESEGKSNLFYYSFDVKPDSPAKNKHSTPSGTTIDYCPPRFVVFADMRGTDIIKIWHDPCPMIYVRPKEKVPGWLYRKACCYIYRKLTVKNIPFRISNEVALEGNSPDDNFPNGYCKLCGDELLSESIFCDKEYERYSCPDCGNKLAEAELDSHVRDRLNFRCLEEEEKYYEDKNAHRELSRYYIETNMNEWHRNFCDSEECQKRRKARSINQAVACSICGIKLAVGHFDESYYSKTDHHVSYFPEVKMPVCAGCHAKIHHSNGPEYQKYRPPTKRPKDYKGE